MDFYCPEVKLVVELDGSVHDSDDAKGYDNVRENLLRSLDCEIIRFRDQEVMEDLEGVVRRLKEVCRKRRPHPP